METWWFRIVRTVRRCLWTLCSWITAHERWRGLETEISQLCLQTKYLIWVICSLVLDYKNYTYCINRKLLPCSFFKTFSWSSPDNCFIGLFKLKPIWPEGFFLFSKLVLHWSMTEWVKWLKLWASQYMTNLPYRYLMWLKLKFYWLMHHVTEC